MNSESHADANRTATAVGRLLDQVAQVLVALAVVEVGILLWLRDFLTPLGRPLTIFVALALLAAAVVAVRALRGGLGPTLRLATRVLVLSSALVAIKVFVDRWPSAQRPTSGPR